MKKRFMIAICCLVLLFNLIPVTSMAESSGASEIDQDLYYCRAQLEEMPNSEALLFAYNNIVRGIDECAKEIIISDKQHKLSMDEFLLVLEAVRRDHTEQFWLSTSYSYLPDSAGNIAKMLPEYLMIGEELADAKVAFQQSIDNMLAHITADMSEYEMEKTLHDLLANKVAYVSTANAHNAYGALVEGLAVCEGYAEALQCLLQRVGIQSIQVYGASRGENHAWNMVRIDGSYYLVDLTWNDQETMLLYAYFNQTSAIFNEDHAQWRVGHDANKGTELSCQVFDLPTCTATAENYFTKNNLRISTYTVESIGNLLKNNGLAVSLFIDSDPEAFSNWFNANIGEIAGTAGLVGRISYGELALGREIYIWVGTRCDHAQLRFVAATPATCDNDGNIAYYVCKNAECGKWFADASAKSIIVNHESVKLLSPGHDFTVKTISEETLSKKAEKCTERDTYYLTCSVCSHTSDTYTFETETAGEHAYPETWVEDDVFNHKCVCSNGCGVDLIEAHVQVEGTNGCAVCGYTFSAKDLILDSIGDIDGGEVLDDVINIVLQNPIILFGGGGGLALLVLIVIIRKIRG